MSITLTIPLSKKDQDRLSRLALRYGFSLPEFSKRILMELSSEIPGESWDEYENPKELKASFRRALHDWRQGRVSAHLWSRSSTRMSSESSSGNFLSRSSNCIENKRAFSGKTGVIRAFTQRNWTASRFPFRFASPDAIGCFLRLSKLIPFSLVPSATAEILIGRVCSSA